MKRTLLTAFIALTISIIPAHADVWKQEPYDEAAYDKAYDTMIEHFDDGEDKIPLLKQISDSMYLAGEKHGNYPVKITALMMRNIILMMKGDTKGRIENDMKALTIAKENQNVALYFSIYFEYLIDLKEEDPSQAFFESRKMIEEARKLNSRKGMRKAHFFLGELLLIERNNPRMAVEEFKRSEELLVKEKNYDHMILFDCYMNQALAYITLNKQKEAFLTFEKAKRLDVFKDGNEYCETSFYITYFSYAEKFGTKEELDKIYRKYFMTSAIKSRYSEEYLKKSR